MEGVRETPRRDVPACGAIKGPAPPSPSESRHRRRIPGALPTCAARKAGRGRGWAIQGYKAELTAFWSEEMDGSYLRSIDNQSSAFMLKRNKRLAHGSARTVFTNLASRSVCSLDLCGNGG